MRKPSTTIPAILAALTLAVGAWVAGAFTLPAAHAAPAAATTRALRFDVRFSPFTVIDFGPAGVRTVTDINRSDPSKGDVSVFRDKLLRAGKVVGGDGGTCTITDVDLAADPPLQITCQVVFDLPGGTLATEGNASNAPVKHLVITGGTGAFLDASGEVTLIEFANDTGTAVVRLAG
jgi:hypothetical protein